jgi:lysozyme
VNNDLTLGDSGAELIKSFEQCRLRAYKPTADDVWTCGWGSTKGVTADTVWTQEEADARFLEDIAWVEECVNRCVTVALSQGEFDALASLVFNIGCGAFGKSTLVKLLNGGDFDAAAKEFRRWDKQGGNVLAGLTRRRAAEAKLFEESFT